MSQREQIHRRQLADYVGKSIVEFSVDVNYSREQSILSQLLYGQKASVAVDSLFQV